MRIGMVIGLAAALGACNAVTSRTPLFSAADARGQPQLRSGLWMDEDKTCVVDTARPVDQWPGCVDSWVVRPGEFLAGRDPGSAPSTWTRYGTVLAGGEAPVLQVSVGDGGGADGYVYVGVRVLKTDADGRVVEFKAWPALCGPPPAPDATGQKSAVVTDRPIAGLVVDKEAQDCVASAQGPVRASVRQSEAWNDADDNHGRDHARWVRDGEE